MLLAISQARATIHRFIRLKLFEHARANVQPLLSSTHVHKLRIRDSEVIEFMEAAEEKGAEVVNHTRDRKSVV